MAKKDLLSARIVCCAKTIIYKSAKIKTVLFKKAQRQKYFKKPRPAPFYLALHGKDALIALQSVSETRRVLLLQNLY